MEGDFRHTQSFEASDPPHARYSIDFDWRISDPLFQSSFLSRCSVVPGLAMCRATVMSLHRICSEELPPAVHWRGGGAPPLCDIPLCCCFFTGPWTVTHSSLCMLRRVAAFCQPLPPPPPPPLGRPAYAWPLSP